MAKKMVNEATFDKFGPSMSNCGTFHLKRGLDVELSEGNTVALIGGLHKFDSYADGPRAVIDMRRIVFSSKPIEVTGTFQVNGTRRKFTNRCYGSHIAFGDKSKYANYYDPHQTMVSISFTDKNSKIDIVIVNYYNQILATCTSVTTQRTNTK